jgi:hypothetical protein
MQYYACLKTKSNVSGKCVKTPCTTSLPSGNRQSETNDNEADEPPLLLFASDIFISLKQLVKAYFHFAEKIKYLPIFFPSLKYLSCKRKVLLFLPPG